MNLTRAPPAKELVLDAVFFLSNWSKSDNAMPDWKKSRPEVFNASLKLSGNSVCFGIVQVVTFESTQK